VYALASVLADAGHSELARDVAECLEISTLPGEILGEARVVLGRVRETEIGRRVDVRTRIDDAIAYVNVVLD